MENVSKTLLASPEGLLHLFLDSGVSVACLAAAFQTDTEVIETSLREAMRKRNALYRTVTPQSIELIRPVGDRA
jgi:hypothetical protein